MNITYSCNGTDACDGIAKYGSIDSIVDSCNATESCTRLAEDGNITSIKSSCNAPKGCSNAASYYGSITSIEESCNAESGCEFAGYVSLSCTLKLLCQLPSEDYPNSILTCHYFLFFAV